MPELYINH